MNTETIDRLFLELSQFTKATTAKELHYQRELQRIIDEPHIDESTEMKLRLIAKEALRNAEKTYVIKHTPCTHEWYLGQCCHCGIQRTQSRL